MSGRPDWFETPAKWRDAAPKAETRSRDKCELIVSSVRRQSHSALRRYFGVSGANDSVVVGERIADDQTRTPFETTLEDCWDTLAPMSDEDRKQHAHKLLADNELAWEPEGDKLLDDDAEDDDENDDEDDEKG